MAIKDIRQFFADIVKEIESPATMRKLGTFILAGIKERTRGQGKGVTRPGGNAVKLKRVSPQYAARRAQTRGKHPQAATGTASNLTLHGGLINSTMLKRATTSQLVLGHRTFKEEQKAEGQEKQGRRYLILSSTEMLTAKKYLTKIVSEK